MEQNNEKPAVNYQPNIVSPNSSGQPIAPQPLAQVSSTDKMPNPLNVSKPETTQVTSTPFIQKQPQIQALSDAQVEQRSNVNNATIKIEINDDEEKLTNKALLFSFIFPPAGIFFGLKAKKYSKSIGNINSNALLAIVLSITFCLLWLVLFYILFGPKNNNFNICNDLGSGTHTVKNVTYVCK